MRRKLAVFLSLLGSAASPPAPALAQAQDPFWKAWSGPWFMGVGWPSWWLICPLMMGLIILVMMFACRFMCSPHRD
jgi:hypothetical protein